VAEDGADNAGRAIERVTIAEAAALLGCHPNTVRNRVMAGMYRAEKFHTESGPTWMIERESLTTGDSMEISAQQDTLRGIFAVHIVALRTGVAVVERPL
jgi:hypothetical protein